MIEVIEESPVKNYCNNNYNNNNNNNNNVFRLVGDKLFTPSPPGSLRPEGVDKLPQGICCWKK